MRFRLETTPEELAQKGPEALEGLGRLVEPYSPALADVLAKAAGEMEEPAELKHQALRDCFDEVTGLYRQSLDAMMTEIARELDAHVKGLKDGPDAREG